MKIALICIHYPPLRSSCAVQMRDLARELLILGHEPIVIVPSEGLHKAYVSEVIDGVQVFRFSSFKTVDVGNIQRAINEMLLPFTILFRIRKSSFPIKELDAIVWYSPTIFFGPVVKVLKSASNCPSYLILRDIFPEWTLDLGILKRGPVYYLFKLVAKYQYSVADIIGVQTTSNLKYLDNWVKKPNRNLEVLNNWLSVADRKKNSISLTGTCLHDRKIFVYIGNMGIAQGMDILVDLAESMRNRRDVGFLFVGRGTEVENLQTSAANKKLDNILFYDEIDSKEIPSLLDMCHIGLIALDPRHKSHNIPGKFLTYMQAGLPVLARINGDTDLVDLIKNENVGRVYIGNEVDDFKNLAEDLIDNENNLKAMSERGRFLSEKMFSSNQAAKQIVSSVSRYI
jgi:glycosyltransferase involved in cell wall biosynthesis